MIFSLIGGLRGIIVAVSAFSAAWAAHTVHHTLFVHPGIQRAAVAQGAAQERLLWEEARRRMLAKQQAERQAAQAAIDQAEQEYHNQQNRAAEAEAALEELLHELETADPAPGAVLPKRLSDHLNQIGR